MKGLDLCRAYYKEIIQPIIKKSIPEIGNSYAAALIGFGSDVLGNDDELSKDHEWGPRCILFLPESLKKYKQKIYNVLNNQIPISFKGFPTRFVVNPTNPTVRIPSKDLSGNVHIEMTTCEDYFEENIGTLIPENDIEWLAIPENRLLELTGGEVFYDGYGKLTCLREYYDRYYPNDVWKYRLAYGWQSLGWDIDLIGLCAKRGDTLSARYCLGISIYRIIRLAFLLNRRYCPLYPKWFHREFYKLSHIAGEIGPMVETCYTESDLASVPQKLNDVCKTLLQYQDNLGMFPKMADIPHKLWRGFHVVDYQSIADGIRETIEGELHMIALDGALDQWITNEDILLDVNSMKSLSDIYRTEKTPRYFWKD